MHGARSYNREFSAGLTGSFCLFFVAMTFVAYGYALHDSLGPGPGFFPFWLGLVGAAVSATLVVQSWRGQLELEGEESKWPDRKGAIRTVLLLIGIAVAAALLEPLGFRLTAFVFTVSMLLALDVRRPVLIVVFGLVSGFGLFHVFYYWLKVPLPIGAFGL
jgi:putative tricarboxylic transport membrane protein